MATKTTKTTKTTNPEADYIVSDYRRRAQDSRDESATYARYAADSAVTDPGIRARYVERARYFAREAATYDRKADARAARLAR